MAQKLQEPSPSRTKVQELRRHHGKFKRETEQGRFSRSRIPHENAAKGSKPPYKVQTI